MFILEQYTLDSEGYYNIIESKAVSESRELLVEYHKKKLGDILLPKNRYFREYCKEAGIDYYRYSSYSVINEIPFLT